MSGESSPYVDHDGMEDEFQYCFPEAAAAEKAQTQFLRNTSQLFQNPKYSDFTINCDGRAWPVHKAIVCPHSKFFEAVCDGGFRESKQGSVTLEEDMPNVVDAALRFMYTTNYDEEVFQHQEGFSPLVLSIHLHTFADKYGIPALANLADAKFLRRAHTDWESPSLADAVCELWTMAPDKKKNMREAVIGVCAKRATALFASSNKQCVRLREVARYIPGFASDMMFQLAKGPDVDEGFGSTTQNEAACSASYICPRCSKKVDQLAVSSIHPATFHCPSCAFAQRLLQWTG